MPSLAETQHLLWRLITAPEGVAAAVAGPGDEAVALRAALERTVQGRGTLGPVERVDIYANMYFYRLLDAIAEDFPAVRGVLGPAGFHNLVTDYLLAHPPTHYSLRYAGARLPEFLRGGPWGAEAPYLADLAEFEWCLVEAFDAPDDPVTTEADLRRVPSDAWAELRFRLHPSVELVRLEWAVHDVRAAVDRGEAPALPPRRAVTRLCVWRRDRRVYHRALEAWEWEALQAAAAGRPFGEVCVVAADHMASVEDAPQRLAAALAAWVADGLLARAP